MTLHDARKKDFSNPPLKKSYNEQWIEKKKIAKLDLGSPLTEAQSFDTI